jgi:hypothetical protein
MFSPPAIFYPFFSVKMQYSRKRSASLIRTFPLEAYSLQVMMAAYNTELGTVLIQKEVREKKKEVKAFSGQK